MRALTRRELQVLQLLANGLFQKQVADRLNISPRTVERHVHNASRGTGMKTTAGIVAQALREGLIQ